MRRVVGVGSGCADGRHVVLCDADGTRPEAEEIARVQEESHLSTGYLFKTGGGWHLLFLDKLPFLDAAYLLGSLPWEDKMHATVGAARREWVLRITAKSRANPAPALYGVFPRDGPRAKSNAHRLFVRKWYNHPAEWEHGMDRTTKIPLVAYTPGSG